MNLGVLRATVKKNLMIRVRAYPMNFFIGNTLTGLYTLLGAWLAYHCLFGGSLSPHFVQAAGTADYMSYVAVGSVVYLFVVRTCLNVSRSLISELREGTLESLMLAPFRRTEYFLGTMLVQTVATFGELAVFAAAAVPFGFRVQPQGLAAFLAVLPLALYAAFAVSMVLGCVMLLTRDTFISQNTLFVAMMLLCGVTFPVEYLPFWLRLAAWLVPATPAVSLVRGALIQGSSPAELAGLMAYTACISTAYLAVGLFCTKRAEKLALEKMEG